MSEIKCSKEIDYKKRVFDHPIYRFSRLQPQNTANLAIGTAGGSESVFELPATQIYNLARSYLSFTATPTATAHKRNWAFVDLIPYFERVQAFTRGGQYICDINYCAVTNKIISKVNTKLSDLLTSDNAKEGNASNLYSSKSLTNAEPAYRYGQVDANSSVSDVPYIEPAYAISGGGAAAEPVITPRIMLGDINKESILNYDKDLYFGEVINLRFQWSKSSSMMCAILTATAAPLVADDAANDASVYTGTVTISSLYLYLAVEKNDSIANQIKAKVISGGMNLNIPFPTTIYNQITNATNRAVSLRINRQHGSKLLRIYHSIVRDSGTGTWTYETSNLEGANVTSFYTALENARLQEFDLRYDDATDSLHLKSAGHLLKDKKCMKKTLTADLISQKS